MTDSEPSERLQAMLSDYVDGTLSPADRAEVDAALAADPALRAELDELRTGGLGLRALGRTPAPPELVTAVEATINRRSAGRFFARRTLGDRVPFGVILILAVIILGFIVVTLYSSTTGSLKRDPDPLKPPPQGQVAPTP